MGEEKETRRELTSTKLGLWAVRVRVALDKLQLLTQVHVS